MSATTPSAPLSPLANVAATRQTLEAFGLATKHGLGQNFLVNDAVIQKIVSLADVNGSDFILEVGPGIGTLTIALLRLGATVVSVERDPDLPPVLGQTCAPWLERFTLLEGDALDLTPAVLPWAPNKFVANLPYAVAATVVLDYFESIESLESATVMVQKEVAERMAAQPGSKVYGAYTVKLRLYAQVTGKFLVGPGNFFPPPRVDSMVVRLDRRPLAGADGTPLDARTLRATATMVDAAFATRRKTLANSCKTYFGGRGSSGRRTVGCLPSIFEAAAIDPRRRGETLSLEEFVRLGHAYQALCEGVDGRGEADGEQEGSR